MGCNQHIVEKGEDKRDQADAGGGDVENRGDLHPVFIFSDFVAILGQSDDNFFGLTPEFLHIIINAKVICEALVLMIVKTAVRLDLVLRPACVTHLRVAPLVEKENGLFHFYGPAL